MDWQDFVDILDTIAPLVTLGFGIYAATNDTKPQQDGNLSRRGKVALWGLIISGVFTMMIKVGDMYVKTENQKALALEKDSTIKAQLAFQDSVAKSFKQSLSELTNLKDASKTTLHSLNGVADDQKTMLLNTHRGFNPLLPVEIKLGYELLLDDILDNHAHKKEIEFYLNKLTLYAKEELLQSRLVAGHHASSIDTTRISFDPMDIPNLDLFRDPRFKMGREYFTALIPSRFFIKLQNLRSVKSPSDRKGGNIVTFEIVASRVNDTIPNVKKLEKLKSRYDAKKRLLHVEIGPVSPETDVTDFVSIYDLENALMVISQPATAQSSFAELEKMNSFSLSYVTIYTGFKLRKTIDLDFTPENKHMNRNELYTRVIKPEEIK